MRRVLCFVLLFPLASAPRPAAAGHWTIAVNGGAMVPTGDFAAESKNDAQAGWQIGGSYDYHWTDTWTFGLDGGWNQNGNGTEGTVFDLGGGNTRTREEDRFSMWQVGAHARYALPFSAPFLARWHALVGGSLYGLTENVTETTTLSGVSTTSDWTSTDKRAGVKLGLGATWWLNAQVGVVGGLDYNVAFFDRDYAAAATLSYASVHAGLVFKIPDTATLPEP